MTLSPNGPTLLSPLVLGNENVPNRVAFGAHRTNLAKNGHPGKKLADYYLARARGGCGLIIIGELTLHPNDRPYEKMLEIYSDQCLQELGQLVEKIHKEGTRVVAQLGHRGFQSSGMISRLPLWGPSPVADVINCELCKEMEAEDIQDVISAFSVAAERLQHIGIDGVEVSIGANSLLRQFLSPLTNMRTDVYGGDLNSRLKLSLEVLQAVQNAIHDDCFLGVELCLDEMFWGGLTPEETTPAALEIRKQGLADYFSATVGTYYNTNLEHVSMHHPAGFLMEKAAAVKAAVDVPIMAGNRISGPKMAERELTEERADLIRWVRPLICEPELVNKLSAGQEETIVHCAYDNQACMGRVARNKSLGCIQNPLAGHENVFKEAFINTGGKSKTVMVVGAGPAGLMAALTAARKGHRVKVFERMAEPGGQLCLARRGPGRDGIYSVVEGLFRRVTSLHVPIHFGVHISEAEVLNESPDGLILATGACPDESPFPGEYGPPHVLTVWQALSNEFDVGSKVLLVDEDGHYRAAGTAEYLADQGKQVDIMTSEQFVGPDIAAQGDLGDVRTRLHQKGTRFYSALRVKRIENDHVVAEEKFTNDTVIFKDYDTVVLATPPIADDGLYMALKKKLPLVLRAGDCIAPRKVGQAVWEAFQAAWRL